jgi:rhodanese-related sulfurtransferase
MKKLSLLIQTLFAFILPSFGQNAFHQHLRLLYKKTVPFIQPAQLAAGLQKKEPYVLLDTRSPAEFNVSHLPNARFVDYDSFAVTQLKNITKETPIVVYCSVGVRSERVGEKLQQAGYKNVRNLYGGFFEWINKGYLVVSRNNQPTDSVHAYNRYWGQWLTKGIKVYE